MEREIKFRGKRKDTFEWVYGSLLDKDYILNYIDLAESWEPLTSDHKVTCRAYEIVPETAGQFIGVKGYSGEYNDRHNNEVELFDGDIVEAWSEGSKGRFVIKLRQESQPAWMLYPAWQHGKMWSIAASSLGRQEGDYYDDLKLIGNIHDNPELLK